LAKGKILLKQEGGEFVLNLKYNHKKIRLKIDQAIKSEQKAESDSTHKAAEEDRKYVIQVRLTLASIV
jgi:cullin 1